MTTKAYLLTETEPGKTREVSSALHSLSGVESVDAVTGFYNIIALVEAPELTILRDLVTRRIQGINGVVRAVTCQCFYTS